ncbi:hypothetical protein ABIE67_009161 [Streptomyces sp. V4I8]
MSTDPDAPFTAALLLWSAWQGMSFSAAPPAAE